MSINIETTRPTVQPTVLSNLQGYDVVLASGSPRRRELLGQLGLTFRTMTTDADERVEEGLTPSDVAIALARNKATACMKEVGENGLVIAADTLVWQSNHALGKPNTAEEACDMLRKLSGRTHHVFTGVHVATKWENVSFYAETEVTFDKLDESEIAYYVDTFRPLDKAGAYGIQEWIGMVGITSIAGSYYNVMGLPVQRLYKVLKALKPYPGDVR